MEGRDYFADSVPLEQLLERVKSSDSTERWAAVIEIGEVGTEDAARALRSTLEDPDEFVREATRAALKKFDKDVLTAAGLSVEPQRTVRVQEYRPGLVRFSSHLDAPPFTPWRIRLSPPV